MAGRSCCLVGHRGAAVAFAAAAPAFAPARADAGRSIGDLALNDVEKNVQPVIIAVEEPYQKPKVLGCGATNELDWQDLPDRKQRTTLD